jgi:hypothetical protein
MLGAVALVAVGCGGSAIGDGSSTYILSTKEAKGLLLQLPYRYEFRHVPLPDEASGALAGKAIGRHSYLNFGVSLGKNPDGVPVPKAGTEEAYGYPPGGFVYTDDLLIRGKNHKWHRPARFHTAAQWNEAGRMEVAMEEKLCKATTGEPCHE